MDRNFETKRRRTFAIISHPDAGKTTLTEKLLLYGGAIHLAGSVKARRAQRHATSDWMELERQRGISITSTVLQFPYRDFQVNLLDTPGHQDFSEDTYRTLTAADSAVMLIDCAKGVETQTKKLFKVCRMRAIPIFTFINKMDRFGREPLDLISELEEILGIRSCPMNWPIGMGSDFRGIYDRNEKEVILFESHSHGSMEASEKTVSIDDPLLPELLGAHAYQTLLEDIEMLDIAGDPFDLERVLAGELTPLFFGSAMNNFGVRSFLESFLGMAPAPVSRTGDRGEVSPEEETFSGFIFKIQANMNPSHRDCIAFLRVVSGKFTKGMTVRNSRSNRDIRLAQSTQIFAQDRVEVEEAYPGDILGLFDNGILRIGDTLCEGDPFVFDSIPRFSPEHFAQARLVDPSKRKQLNKGLDQLCEEGAVQLFNRPGEMEPILGAVGVLQFDVLKYRLQSEYSVEIRLDPLPFEVARWLEDAEAYAKNEKKFRYASPLEDRDGRPLLLFRDEWAMRWEQDHHPELKFLATAPGH
ncbi:MAG TPA: peptide chain release factor 3 [Chroococcales cyanobacterium]